MAGGLMNLVSQGQQNVIINGNPSKTFWKSSYAKHTNFGLQKFRIDYEGSRTLQLSEDSDFLFKIPRYADLLMDSYISIKLPHIWSPIMPPQQVETVEGETVYRDWAPYEFKWIEHLGAQMIKKISITCGNQKIQEFSGQYLLSMIQRDFSESKKNLFYEMIGHTPELNDPGNSGSRVNTYPNAFFEGTVNGPEPSIRGRNLYIPMNPWFQLKTQMAFPLVSLQYNELHVNVTFRSIQEMFKLRDVFDEVNMFPYIAPNFNQYYQQLYRFLQPPPSIQIDSPNSYLDTRTSWDADIHIVSTYCFLSNDEQTLFAKDAQKYIYKQVQETTFYNVTGSTKVQLDSHGLVTSWMWYFQRSDVNLRNEWSNYTNWPYNYLPNDLLIAPTGGDFAIDVNIVSKNSMLDNSFIPNRRNMIVTNNSSIGPGVNPDGRLTRFMLTGSYNIQNEKEILISLGVLLDGQYRENVQKVGVYDYIEKYVRTQGNASSGLYCYNFCLNTSPYELQPTGAINMSRFTQVELEFTTIVPPADPLAHQFTICNPITGEVIGTNKQTWRLYDYNYNLVVFEERLNIVDFVGGNAALMYAT